MTAIPNSIDEPDARPPHAVVGSQISRDEEMFGAAYDGRVVGRFFEYVKPYRRRVYLALLAVLVFTLTQLSIPLIIRMAIDEALLPGRGGAALLLWVAAAFGAAITVNYAANLI